MPSEPGEGRCLVTFLLGRHDMHYLSTLDQEPTTGQSTDSAKSKLVNPYTFTEVTYKHKDYLKAADQPHPGQVSIHESYIPRAFCLIFR